ncbi:hypothetical protein CJP46_01510 [Paenibacillus sp. XY044]|nr:hypothetical protein CJP46_01510 [Paenibacillus sp. XY044]
MKKYKLRKPGIPYIATKNHRCMRPGIGELFLGKAQNQACSDVLPDHSTKVDRMAVDDCCDVALLATFHAILLCRTGKVSGSSFVF